MATLLTVSEAAEVSNYTHEHIAYLVRERKIRGRKGGRFWLVELESLKEYEAKMAELGTLKHDPTRSPENSIC